MSQQSQSSVTKYRYDPLPNSDSIRLLELQPGDKTDPISCRLFLTRLQDEPQYEAITYVWGDPNTRVSILVNDKTLGVTPSLQDALLQVRSPILPRILWADAICINQEDMKERGHQVGMMARIYENARSVLICLNDINDSLAEKLELVIEEISKKVDHNLAQYRLYEHTPRMKIDKIHDLAHLPLSSFDDLMRNPWFSRLWVLQEIGLANKGFIVCGERYIDWESVMKTIMWKTRVPRASPGDGSDVRYTAWRSWYSFKPESRARFIIVSAYQSFLELLRETRKHRALDPRDHLYAQLSHPASIRDRVQSFLEPDYEKTPEHVYREFTIGWINEHQSVDIVAYSGHALTGDGALDLPSWVPRWDDDFTNPNPLYIFNYVNKSVAINASNGSKCHIRQPTPTQLQVKGFILSTASEKSNRLSRGVFFRTRDSEPSMLLEPFLEEVIEQTGRTKDLLRACYLAMIGGIDRRGGSRATFSDFASFILPVARSLESLDAEALREIEKAAEKQPDPSEFISSSKIPINQRNLFLTDSNRLGLGPYTMDKGDLCCIVFGASTPWILRPVSGDEYIFVGDTYLEGVMHSEAMKMLEEGKYSERWFTLV